MTRMATAAIMRKTLMRAQRYMNKKEAGEDIYEPDMEALIPLLKREIPAHFHAHRADDILTAIRIAHEFNLKYCILHATGAEKITDCIKMNMQYLLLGRAWGLPVSRKLLEDRLQRREYLRQQVWRLR